MSLILFTRKTKVCIPITSWCITLQRGWKNPNTELQRKNQQQQKNRHNNIRNTQQLHKNNRQHKAWQQFDRLATTARDVQKTKSLEPNSYTSNQQESWIGLSLASDAMRFGFWDSPKGGVLTNLPPSHLEGRWEKLDIEEDLKPVVFLSLTTRINMLTNTWI